jgi:hypothetical protein
MEKLDTDKSVLLVSRDTLGTLFKGYNEWNSLTVKMTDADEGKLVRGELASILEIPRGKKTNATAFEHPFKLTADGANVTISEGRIQFVNYPVSFITIPQHVITPGPSDFIWLKVIQLDAENKISPSWEIGFGPSTPTDAREHKLVYTVWIPYDVEGAPDATDVAVSESQTYIHYFILGRMVEGVPEQFIVGDIFDKWSPVVSVAGNATTIP